MIDPFWYVEELIEAIKRENEMNGPDDVRQSLMVKLEEERNTSMMDRDSKIKQIDKVLKENIPLVKRGNLHAMMLEEVEYLESQETLSIEESDRWTAIRKRLLMIEQEINKMDTRAFITKQIDKGLIDDEPLMKGGDFHNLILEEYKHLKDQQTLSPEEANRLMAIQKKLGIVSQQIEAPLIEFKSGAIRSGDAENEAYWLISPIGLRRLATAYSTLSDYPRGDNHLSWLNLAIQSTYIYLSGARELDHLAIAAMAIFESITVLETGHCTSFIKDYHRVRYDLISPIGFRKLAETYKEGNIKYPPYNWEKGMPIHDLLNHGIRHIYLFLSGDRSEPHLPHSSWAYFGAMHSEELWPELNEGQLRGPNCSRPLI